MSSQPALLLYKVIFDHLDDSTLLFNKKGKIVSVNKVLLNFGHFKQKELIGRSVSALVVAKEKDRVEELITKVLKKQIIIRDFSTIFLTKTKKEIPVSFNLCPLVVKNQMAGGFGVFADVRQIRGLLETLGKAKAELEKRVRERTKKLQEKVKELESFHKLAIGRELKMIALKGEVEKLKKELEESHRGQSKKQQQK